MPNQLQFSPGVDVITDRVALVMQDRPVVGLSAWLEDAFAAAINEGRDLQLVTPARTRLTYPVRTRLFTGRDARWVVSEPGHTGVYDGLSGVRLEWDGQRFAQVGDADSPELSPAFAEEVELRRQLQVTARVRYQPLATTIVGGAAELLFTELSGAAPAGWGTEEPVTQPWRPEALTAFCRDRSPQGTWLPVVGARGDDVRPAVGSIEIHHRPAGLEETVSLAVAVPDAVPSADELRPVVEKLANEFELVSCYAQAARGAADTTAVPYWVGLPAPIGMAMGNDGVRPHGIDAVLSVAGVQGSRIGPLAAPGVWYPIGDGTNQLDWNVFSELTRRLAEMSPQDFAATPPR